MVTEGRVQPQLAVRISAAPSGVRAFPWFLVGPWSVVPGWPVVPGERVQPQLAVRISAAPSGAGQVRWVLGGLGFSPSWRCACRLLLPVRVGSGRSWWWAGVSPSWRCACPLLLPVDVCVPIVPRSCSAPASGVHIFASVLCSAGMPDLASFSKHYRPMEGLWPVPEYFSCPSPAEVRVDSRG